MTNKKTTILDELLPTKRMIIEKLNFGSLMGYRQKNGAINFYFRYFFNGKDHTYPIGPYDEKLNANSTVPSQLGHSVKSAIRAAELLSQEQRLLSTQNKSISEKQVQAKFEKKQKLEQESKLKDKTLGALLEIYQKTLTNHKTALNVRSIFNNLPKDLLAQQANQISHQVFDAEISKISRRTTSIGDKAHVFLRAAYGQAFRPTSNLVPKKDFYDFEINFNPLLKVTTDYIYDPDNSRPLSDIELKNYWENLKGKEGHEAASLRLHVLLGGVRMWQLRSLKKSDLLFEKEEDEEYLLLQDEKTGAPTNNRKKKKKPHTLPLTDPIKKELEILKSYAVNGEFLFSANKGKTKISEGIFRDWSRKFEKTNPNKIEDFSPKRIRSSLTILFYKLNIPRDVSNQIQSHGSTDPQVSDAVIERHYTWHFKNLKNKKEALNQLFAALNPPPKHLKLVKKNSA